MRRCPTDTLLTTDILLTPTIYYLLQRYLRNTNTWLAEKKEKDVNIAHIEQVYDPKDVEVLIESRADLVPEKHVPEGPYRPPLYSHPAIPSLRLIFLRLIKITCFVV